MNPDMPLSAWVVLAVASAIITVLGFLIRNAFEGVTKGLEGLGAKLDAMGKDISRGDGDRRELGAEVRALRERLERLEREVSEGVAR